MAKKNHIAKYTAEELAELVNREGTSSDGDKAARMTKVEIEARAASDPDEAIRSWIGTMQQLRPHSLEPF
jgi:hypothetical protein